MISTFLDFGGFWHRGFVQEQRPLYFFGFEAPGVGGPPPSLQRGVPRKQTCSSELLIFLEDFDDFHGP